VPHADANGLRIFYEDSGEGQPLLLVQGLGGDHLAWAEQLGAWTDRFRVIAFDNRDCGQSSYVDEAYEIEDMAADTLALADALELDRFHLLGLSMGGMIAQHVALTAPDRLLSLTLAMTYAGAGRWGKERARLMAYDAMRRPRREQIEGALVMCFSEEVIDDPESLARFRDMELENPHPQSVEGYCRQVQAMGDHDLRDRLGEVRVPTHVIVAEHDMVIPPWKQHELAGLIPGAQVSVLDTGTHGANMEHAEDFNELVLGFLIEARDREVAEANP
jgi:3-oxoadipate enol-lactonase